MNYELTLIVAVILILLFKLWSWYRDRQPHIATILLPDNHTRFFLEYWEYYPWYDINGSQMWSKRIKRIHLFTI